MPITAHGDPFVSLGVMSNPMKPLLRMQWREWASHFHSYDQQSVQVRFVFGTSFYESMKPHGAPTKEQLTEAELQKGDLVFVDGRERLPNVGVVTEKSAAFWLTAVERNPTAKWHCKCDDDTLVHLDRLESDLRQVERQYPDEAVYLGHFKWRGWDAGDHGPNVYKSGFRYQACGGTWGDSAKTKSDILFGGVLGNGNPYPPCPHAAGPYVYMSGGMVCMSRKLAARLARDEHFANFNRVAHERNTAGARCRKPLECAKQPAESHMWHHEDAGIGYTVFRATVAANESTHLIPVPAHYNDPGIIERTEPKGWLDANDQYWSTRSIFVHGVKTPKHFAMAKEKWNLSRTDAVLKLSCYPCDQMPPGVNRHYGNWKWSRVPCPPAMQARGAGDFCEFEPKDHFNCCNWPWDIPTSMKEAAEGRRKAEKLRRSLEGESTGRKGGKGRGRRKFFGKGKGKGRRAADQAYGQ